MSIDQSSSMNRVVSLCGRLVGCDVAYATILVGKHNRHHQTVAPKEKGVGERERSRKMCLDQSSSMNRVVSLCGRLVGCDVAYATILVGKHNSQTPNSQPVAPKEKGVGERERSRKKAGKREVAWLYLLQT